MATQPDTTNVVPIRRPRVPETFRPAVQSTETALLLGLLGALSVGDKRSRRLFKMVGGEVARMADRRPDSLALAAASDILSLIREANYGR